MIEEVEMRNNYNVEPLRMLYLLKEKYRAQDFFHKINKDHNDCLTPDELHALFKVLTLSVCLSACLPVCLPDCLSAYVRVCVCAYVRVCVWACVFEQVLFK